MSSERQTVLQERLAAQQQGANTNEGAPAAPPPAAAAAPAAPAPSVPSQSPAPAVEDDDARDRYTYYLDTALAEDFEEKVHALFWDARGALSKGDIYTAVLAAGLERWDMIRGELWAKTKETK